MKWNKVIVYITVISMLAVSGCSAGTAGAVDDSTQAVSDVKVEVNSEDGTKRASEESRNETGSESSNEISSETSSEPAVKAVSEEDVRNAQNSTIVGKIVTIYGNYIQVDKVELPEKTGSRMSGNSDTKSTGSSESSQTNLASAMGGGGMPPGGNRPPGAGSGSGRSASDMEFSGEIVDVMIPVGSDIYSSSDETLELTYDSLNKGMIVKIKVDFEMTEEFQDQTDVETFYADNVMVVE